MSSLLPSEPSSPAPSIREPLIPRPQNSLTKLQKPPVARHASGPASLSSLISKSFRKSFESSRDARFPPRPGLVMDLPEDEQPRNDGLDPMPLRPEILYTRLDYHVAELKRLQALVVDLNKAKKGVDARLDDMDKRQDPHDELYMDNSITVAEQLHEHIIQSRNGLGKFIGFHRREIERCAEAIVRMKDKQGESRTLPVVLKDLPNEYEWKALFLF